MLKINSDTVIGTSHSILAAVVRNTEGICIFAAASKSACIESKGVESESF